MRWIARAAPWLLALCLCTWAFAQDKPAAAPEMTVVELRRQLDKVPRASDSNEEAREFVNRLNAIGAQSVKFIAARTGELADLNARLGELGSAPAAAATEDPDITRQRAALEKQRNGLDADIRLARLVVVDAQQRGDELLTRRRESFEAQLTERAPSPLGREFWADIADAWPTDVLRLRSLGVEVRNAVAVARQPEHRWPVLGSLLLALLLVLPANLLAERGLVQLAARVLPPGRLRRSLLVVAIVFCNVVLVGLATQGVHATLEAHRAWGPQTIRLSEAAVRSSIMIAFIVGLGRALLSNARPSWRLPPISDAMAGRLAPFPWLTALVALVTWAPSRVNLVVEASFAAVLATHVFTALALTGLIGGAMLRLRAPRFAPAGRSADRSESAASSTDVTQADAVAAERPVWIGLLLGTLTLMIAVIWVLVAVGYVALGSLLAAQLTWAGVVAAAFYLLFKFVDDLFTATVSSRSAIGQRLHDTFGFAPTTLDQSAVLLSGVARLVLFFYMLIALAAPLGTGPGEVFQRSGRFGGGLKIGEFQLVPGALATALAVLVGGFIALRVLKRWMERRYLPQTALEPGMQTSVTTLLGYVGGVLVVAIALSALGIGVERIAWVASALSVGIGFGLQAIVQNFISGLILLAERPVKVGDWVVLGATEGDVRRINVRATEIQLGDRSTLIVPNSEFITKTVRNMTLVNAEGRVLIRLPMPLTTDARRVRELMLAACAEHAGVLDAPAPSLTLEGVEGGMLIFQAIAYVPSPRLAGGVRSDLLFEILERLKAAGLPLAADAAPQAAPSTAGESSLATTAAVSAPSAPALPSA